MGSTTLDTLAQNIPLLDALLTIPGVQQAFEQVTVDQLLGAHTTTVADLLNSLNLGTIDLTLSGLLTDLHVSDTGLSGLLGDLDLGNLLNDLGLSNLSVDSLLGNVDLSTLLNNLDLSDVTSAVCSATSTWVAWSATSV